MPKTVLTDIASIFSIFHDGCIVNVCSQANHISMDIEIPYLATMTNPAHTFFKVRLYDFANEELLLWLNADGAVSQKTFGAGTVFEEEPEILEARVEEERVILIFNQGNPACNYCGGELYFSASAIEVQDEAGKSYSASALQTLCSRYWKDWSVKNKDRY